MARLVVFDMDGVLVDAESSWVHVHRHFGVNNDHSLHAYLRGEIDDLEFIRRDIRLWKAKDPDVTESVIRKTLEDVSLMPGAAKTVRELKDSGVRTAIVSAGIDLLAEMISSQLGIDTYLANGLVAEADGRLTGEGVLRVRLMDKGEAVTDVRKKMRISLKDTVSVGNSQYDVSMFKKSGKGIAFMPADDSVRASADAVIDEKDLTGILHHI